MWINVYNYVLFTVNDYMVDRLQFRTQYKPYIHHQSHCMHFTNVYVTRYVISNRGSPLVHLPLACYIRLSSISCSLYCTQMCVKILSSCETHVLGWLKYELNTFTYTYLQILVQSRQTKDVWRLSLNLSTFSTGTFFTILKKGGNFVLFYSFKLSSYFYP